MTVRRIREEMDALREALIAPVAGQQISALSDINVRLDRLAERQSDSPGQPTNAEMAGLSMWWRQRFNTEMRP